MNVSPAAYLNADLKVVRVGEKVLVARLAVPCAAVLTDPLIARLEDPLFDQLSELVTHTASVRMASTVSEVFGPCRLNLDRLNSQTRFKIIERDCYGGLRYEARAALSLEVTKRGEFVLAQSPDLDWINAYPANWPLLLSSVQSAGFNPYDVDEVLRFTRTKGVAEFWGQKVATFRDKPRSWAHLVMREMQDGMLSESIHNRPSIPRGKPL